MSSIFGKTGASLFVDASNAFNSLNRATTLLNVPNVCPALAPILINTYREPVPYGETLLSTEGTTQGDPLGMAMYAIGIQPLIKLLRLSRSGMLMTLLLVVTSELFMTGGPNFVTSVQNMATIPTSIRLVY